MPEHWEEPIVDGAPMRTLVCQPEGASSAPGIVVIMHGVGLDDFSLGIARRLAQEGYVAAAPDMYHREPPEAASDFMACLRNLRDDTVMNDVNATVDILKAHPRVEPGKLGITGFCMGGRITYLAAASNPDFRAAVVFYGGGIRNAWGDGPSALDLTKHIACPVLGLFGQEDQDPSPEHVSQIDAEMTKHGKAHEFHTFENAGHAFMAESRPQMYNEPAAKDAWAKMMGWFGKHLA